MKENVTEKTGLDFGQLKSWGVGEGAVLQAWEPA